MHKRESSRPRILNSADELFHGHGYDAVTVDQICEHSGSAKGSFYHFFRSKEDLAIALLDDLWQDSLQSLERTFSTDRQPLEQIRDELHRVYTSARHSRERSGRVNGCPIGFLAATLSSRSDKIRARSAFHYNHMRQFYLAPILHQKRRQAP